MLLAVDGLSSYVKAFRRAFRTPLRAGKSGRPRLLAWPKIAIVQVVKQRKANELSLERRIVQGCEKMIEHLLRISQHGGMINTAYIERLNATLRQGSGQALSSTPGLAGSPHPQSRPVNRNADGRHVHRWVFL